MTTHEVFQMHCRRCFQRFEAESLEAALAKVEAHEQTHEVKK